MNFKETAYKQAFSNFLSLKNRHKTPERFAILKAALHFNAPFTIAEVKLLLTKKKYAISSASLYNNFILLEEALLVGKVICEGKIKYQVLAIPESKEGIALYLPCYHQEIETIAKHNFTDPSELNAWLADAFSLFADYKILTTSALSEAFAHLFHHIQLTPLQEIVVPACAPQQLITAILRCKAKPIMADFNHNKGIALNTLQNYLSNQTRIIVVPLRTSSSNYGHLLAEEINQFTTKQPLTHSIQIVFYSETPLHFINLESYLELPSFFPHYIITPLHFNHVGEEEVGAIVLTSPSSTSLNPKYTYSLAPLPQLYAQFTAFELKQRAHIIQKLKTVAAQYKLCFSNAPDIVLPTALHPFTYYPIQITGISIQKRDDIINKLKEIGIETRGLPAPCISFSKDTEADKVNFPNYYQQLKETICLPLHTFLTEAQVKKIADAILQYKKS